MWNSDSTSTPFVRYGLSPDSLNVTTQGISYTYTLNEFCGDFFNNSQGPHYWIDPGMQHGAHSSTP